MTPFELPLLGSNQDSPDPESGVLPVTPRGSALDFSARKANTNLPGPHGDLKPRRHALWSTKKHEGTPAPAAYTESPPSTRSPALIVQRRDKGESAGVPATPNPVPNGHPRRADAPARSVDLASDSGAPALRVAAYFRMPTNSAPVNLPSSLVSGA